jgi:hypothetical protein
MKLHIVFFLSFTIALTTASRLCYSNDTISSEIRKKRLIVLGVGVNLAYTSSMLALNEVWYKNSPRTSFHFFNDNNEWNQLDKIGHFTTAFHESAVAIHALRWAGLSEKKAVLIGSLAGFVYQTPIEYFDGRSSEYGASWGDIIANTSGSALVLGQHLLWNEIRIQPKFSFHRTKLAKVRSNLLGSNLGEEIIKDYNGQTYWLSCNVSSFIKNENSTFPKWLNIAFGYGAQNMIRATKELSLIEGYKPYRQYYLSFDVDLSHVKTKKKWVKYLLYPLNLIHIPFPAIELSKKGLTFHPIYF